MKPLILFATLGIFAAAPVAAQAAPTAMTDTAYARQLADARRGIDLGNAEWSKGWLTRDAKLVASIFADSGVQLASSGRIIKGRKAIEERQRTGMAGADSGVKVTVTTANVWLVGPTAYESGKYRYEYTDHGKPGVDEGQYVTAWQRQRDGSWKLIIDLGLPNP